MVIPVFKVPERIGEKSRFINGEPHCILGHFGHQLAAVNEGSDPYNVMYKVMKLPEQWDIMLQNDDLPESARPHLFKDICIRKGWKYV